MTALSLSNIHKKYDKTTIIENLSLEGDVHKQGVSGTDDRGRLTIEPSVKAQMGPARVAAGFLIPVSGPQSDLSIYGGRLVVGGHF